VRSGFLNATINSNKTDQFVVRLDFQTEQMDFRDQMKRRSKNIGLETIKLMETLPQKPVAWVLSKQILRSSTSIGANYRAAYRAKSNADFIYKLKIVEEETDETIYWLEILQESGMIPIAKTEKLISETKEVLAIVVSSIKSSRRS
jgi:four helix bundle protein